MRLQSRCGRTFWLSVMPVVLAIIATFLALARISRYALWIPIVGYMILVISYIFGTARSPRRLRLQLFRSKHACALHPLFVHA